MKKQELHCLVIRGHVGRYPALVQSLSKFSNSIKVRLIDNDVLTVKQVLENKKYGLIFLFQESGLAINALADIMRENGSEAILVSLNEDEPQSVLSKKIGYTGVQICNLHYQPSGYTSQLALKFLIQYAFLKAEFRNCKSLLRVSEQRCHWLVDSSSEAVAYIGNDLHLYANQAYINLLSYDSLHSLKVTAVSDLILEDERRVFFDFMRQYENQTAKASALIITLHPQKGEDFRASIRLIPTVFSGTRCYQLWIRRLGASRLSPVQNEKRQGYDASSSLITDGVQAGSSWNDSPVFKAAKEGAKKAVPKVEHPVLGKKKTFKRSKHAARFAIATHSVSTRTRKKINNVVARKPPIYSKLLKEIVLSNDVNLRLSKLDVFNNSTTSVDQCIVDLDVSEREYLNVSGLLAKKYHDVFWAQAMILLLFKHLKQAGSKDMRLLIPLNESALQDDSFKHWIRASVSRFKDDVSNCVFLLPLFSDVIKNGSDIESISRQFSSHLCQVGIDNFVLNKQTKVLLRMIHPEFVRFSKKWISASIKNKKQVLKLANTIRVLEKNNIKVIAPYNSGERMRQLFDMAGASFCHKQAVS
jgi:PAS domain-containing protein